MSIANRIAEAMTKMDANDAENALIQTSIAVDATSKLVYGSSGKKNYRDFIHSNLSLITKVAFGSSVQNINLSYDLNRYKAPHEPKIDPDPNGLYSIQHILYHAVRCGLLHEGQLPPDIEFTKDQVFRVRGDAPDGEPRLVLPVSLVYGLIVAVVCCPNNKDLRVGDNFGIQIANLNIPINLLWGRKDDFESLQAAFDLVFEMLEKLKAQP